MSDELERKLQSLCGVGEPRVSKLSGGWHATIDIPAPPGCDASVKSDFGMSSPSAAVDQMIERLTALRRTFGVEPLRLGEAA